MRWLKTGVFLLLCLVGAGIVWSCAQPNPTSKTPIASLILNVAVMPPGWHSPEGPITLPAQDSLGAQKAHHIFMENRGVTASYDIYEYSSEPLAAFHFWFNDPYYFPGHKTEWSEFDLKDLDLHADQQKIACAEADDLFGPRCSAALRYGINIATFYTGLGENILDAEDFKSVLIAIEGIFVSSRTIINWQSFTSHKQRG